MGSERVTARCCQPRPGTDYEEYSFGGAQIISNTECRAQREGKNGVISADAICADQPEESDYDLRCMATNSDNAYYDNDFGVYISNVQCPKGTAMFDCTSFIKGRTEDCGGDPSLQNDEILMGEYYRKDTKKSKVYCEAKADTDKVRVQATCCEFVTKKPGN